MEYFKLQPLKKWVPMSLRYRLMELRGRSLYSGYFDANRCVFIHIPKTAGTSIARALFGKDSRHIACTEYEKANPKKFRSYFKFAFVRNPWDRLFSAYSFLIRGGLGEDDQQWAETNLVPFGSFERFVHEWINEENINSWVHFKPQCSFITNVDGQIAMDFLGRMENINADFELVCRKLGISASLPVLNRIDKASYTNAYSPEMIRIVERAYHRDVSALGYRFDGSS